MNNFKKILLITTAASSIFINSTASNAAALDYNNYFSNINTITSKVSSTGNPMYIYQASRNIDRTTLANVNQLMSMVSNAENTWNTNNNTLSTMSASDRLATLSSASYQDAYARQLYINKYLKPLLSKLYEGEMITLTQAKQIADTTTINNLIAKEKTTTVATYVATQSTILKSQATTITPTPTPTPAPIVTSTVINLSPIITTNTTNGVEFTESNISFSDSAATSTATTGIATVTKSTQDSIADVSNTDGTITRTTKRITTTTTTTPKTTVSTVQRTFVDKVYKNVTTVTVTTPRTKTTYSDGREIITEGTPVTTNSTPVKTFVRDITRTETIETGRKVDNTITSTNNSPGEIVSITNIAKTISNIQSLTPVVFTSTSEGTQYITTSYIDGEPISVVVNGASTVSTATSSNIINTKNINGSITRNTYNITTTTTITPKTTNVTKIRTYTDAIKKDITVTTTTTPVTRNNYSDGTYLDVKSTPVITTVKEIKVINTNIRTETITVSNNTDNITTTSSNAPGVLVSTISIAAPVVSSNDPNMGTPTAGVNSDPNFYKTNEFMNNNANSQINADKAYARGWTGKGVTVAVADTGYLTSHTDLQGQVIATKDYTGTGINDTQGHGTHVLGTIVALKNDIGTHGVAFDAKAIVIKIGSTTSVNTDNAALGFVWAADQGAVVGNLSANSSYDPTFRKNLVGISDGTYISTDSRYNYGAGKYYNVQDPNLWKSVTDRGMIVVNAAGNQGLAVAANPGYFATVTDASGNLLLGGRMLIVGAVDENNRLYSWSNRAGHICQQYNATTSTCADKYKVSDFYILAPGGTNSTSKNGDVGYMEGTSMAAPVVTGGVAIVSQMWPYMKGENIVKLLTTTANKNIPDYNKETHGSGVLDLDRATQPVGAVGIPTSGKTTSSVKTTTLTNTGGTGSALSAISSTGALSKVMIIDEFARDFYLNMENGITFKDKRKTSDVKIQQNNTTYLPFQQAFGTFEQGGEGYVLPGLKLGIASGKENSKDYSSYITTEWNFSQQDDKGNKQINNQGFNLRTTLGTVGEKNNWLGNESSGALSVGNNNNTYFSQIGVDYINKQDKWSIDVGQGFTTVKTTDNSLIKKMSTIQSQSVKLGYENSLTDNQKWGMTASLPNYISKGSATISVPYATTLDGEIIYDNIKANLRSRTPEKNLGLYYTDIGESEADWRMQINTEYRNNIAGQSGKNGLEFGIQFERKF